MLLEDCAASGRTCRVLCSQPRRISAVTVASRVAAERGEQVGQTSGYSIRLESAASNGTALMFVTTGAVCPNSMSEFCDPQAVGNLPQRTVLISTALNLANYSTAYRHCTILP